MVLLVLCSSAVLAVQWHDCCEVELDEGALRTLYEDAVRSQCHGEEFSVCLAKYEERAARGEVNGYDDFRRILVEEPQRACRERNRQEEYWFNGGCEGVMFCAEAKEYYPGTVFAATRFQDPSYELFSISPKRYSVEDGSLWKLRRDVPKFRRGFRLADSRFASLIPPFEVSSFQEKFDAALQTAETTCHERGLSKDGAAYKEYLACLEETIPLSPEEKSFYEYLTGKAQYFIEGLVVCEEELGFQNDLGLVSFPGQGCSGAGPDGCCEGYHLDEEFGVCCPEGFAAYEGPGGTVRCGPAPEDEIVSVEVSLEKEELVLDGEDSLVATLRYRARSPAGEIVPYAGRHVNGVVARAETSGLEFSTKLLADTTDDAGRVQARISLKKAALGLLPPEPVTVFVWALDDPSPGHERRVSFRTKTVGVRITALEQLSGPAWQGAPVQLRVTVADPLHEKKLFSFLSGTSFRVDGKTEEFAAYKTTRENSVSFAWFAPKVSREMKLQYATRVRNALIAMGLVAGEDLMGAALDARKAQLFKEGALSPRFSKVNGFYEGLNKVVSLDSQAAGAVQQGRQLVEATAAPYQLAKKGVGALLWLEGTIGLVGSPASPVLTSLKVGLTGIDAWYSLVEDLEKVAKAEKVTLEFPVTVKVEGLQTHSVATKTITIPVQGFEIILGGEE